MYVFMDIEATGQVHSEAFQVAMVITNEQFQIKEMLNFYVEHELEINPHVLELCHLTDADLWEIDQISYSRSAAVEVIERVFGKYKEEMIFVGKMIKGDIKWLRKIGVRCNRMDFLEESRYIELNDFFEENRKLQEDCLKWGFSQRQLVKEVKSLLGQGKLSYGVPYLIGSGYHNAVVDAYAVYRIFKAMVAKEELDLLAYCKQYDWNNRSYLMMNRKAMEDKISVKIYQNQLLKELKEEYGIHIAYKDLKTVDSIMFDNGCMMGVTKREILTYLYADEIKKHGRPYYNRYEVRVRRKKYIKKLNIVALNRFELFIKLSEILSPQHIPSNFNRRSVIVGLLQNPCAYLIANGYDLVSIKQKETHIEFREIG